MTEKITVISAPRMVLLASEQSWRIDVTRLVISPDEYFQKKVVSRVRMRAITALCRLMPRMSLRRNMSLLRITSMSAVPTTTPPKRAATGKRSKRMPLGMMLLKICLLMNGINMPKRLTTRAVERTAVMAEVGRMWRAYFTRSIPLRGRGGRA